jgi:NAD(P)H-quinone oxidoreductase subunit 5
VALHGLLLFYPERKVAVAAARKKFALARAADACLAVALFLLFRATGTTDILATNESIARHGSSTWSGLAATLVVLAAIFKSAQLPFSGWLFEVVETPTPVSALLHAGLLNGGAFLVMRLSGVVSQSTVATSVLVVVGATTAALLSLSMTAQPAIKISLAHSSAAHMGYTLMLAGLGAYSFALLHLVAHSCYKAHAFLSTGTTVKDVASRPAPVGKSFGAIVLYVLGAGLVFAGMTRLLGIATDGPVDGARSVVFVLGLTLLFARSATLSGRPATLATALTAAATTLVFLALERIVWLASSTSFAHAVGATTARVALSAFVVGIFSTTAVVQLRHHGWGRHSTWRVFYVWLKNGFFLNSFVDRAIGSFVVPAAPVTLPSPDSQRS